MHGVLHERLEGIDARALLRRARDDGDVGAETELTAKGGHGGEGLAAAELVGLREHDDERQVVTDEEFDHLDIERGGRVTYVDKRDHERETTVGFMPVTS